MSTFMKTLVIFAGLLLATCAVAQSPAPAPQRPASGLNLNLKLDDATRRSIVSEPAADQRGASKDGKESTLPSLGAGNPARSFDAPTGSRPKSTGSATFPKGGDAM
jgi:hypothetical protein